MKKTLRSAISVILIFILGVSICAPAFAADTAQFEGYVSLGDSIACGYTDEYYTDSDSLWDKTSDWSFNHAVASAVGAKNENYTVGNFCGARSAEIYMLLGGEEVYDGYNSGDGFYIQRCASILTHSAEAQQAVKNAGLVTVCLGANDIAANAFRNVSITEESTPAEIAEEVAKAVENLFAGYDSFREYYPKLLAKIRELNKDAKIVSLSVYNPGQGLPITDSDAIPVFDALSVITAYINRDIKAFSEAMDNSVFVDISDTETTYNDFDSTPVSFFDELERIIWYVHPTQEGQKYIARQIIKALETKKTVSTDIGLDLNGMSAKGVTAVLVDGRAAQFTVEDAYTITVKCDRSDAGNVTVFSLEKGKLQITLWQVKWSHDAGYTSWTIARTSDAAGTAGKLVSNIRSAANTIAIALESLFKR